MQRYYAILSGEHPTIPGSELYAILEVEAERYRRILDLEGVSLFEAELPEPGPQLITFRAGWVKEVGLLLGVAEAEENLILAEATRIVSKLGGPRDVKVRAYKKYSEHIDTDRLKQDLRKLRGVGGYILRVFITEGAAILGAIVSQLDTRALHYRRPGKRPFFRPGPLSPNLTRAMINLARTPRGGTFLDPFCGTGGFPLEACYMGAGRCLCGDINESMVKGSRLNLDYYGIGGYCLVSAFSATALPIKGGRVDAIATDPPYGRSTSTRGRGYSYLTSGFLREARRVLKPGGYVVYAGPLRERPYRIAEEEGFTVVERHHMYVHSSLTREVVVARLG